MAETTYSAPDLADPTADNGTAYWSSEDEVADSVKRRRKLADSSQSEWRQEATDLYAFVAGEQWREEDQKYREDVLKRPVVTFNRVGPIINAVCGQQICNRQETRFLAREPNDMQTADLWGQVVAWVREQCDAEDEESDCFRDLVITGMGWTCTTVAYDEDPAGMVLEQRIDPRRHRWDPSSRKKNLADARWIQCDYWWTREQITEKWPDARDIVIEPGTFATEDEMGQPHDATNSWRYSKNTAHKDLIAGQYRCIHDIHWRLEDVYQIPDVNGEITKLTLAEWEQLQGRLTTLGMPSPQVAKTQARIYYEAWMVGGTVLAFGVYPEKDFEYQCMTGLRDERGVWYGLAKALIDPQRFANKIFTEIVAILGSNAKGGIIAEKGAVLNQKKFEEEWAKSDGVSWVEDGAVTNSRIQPKPPPQIPAELTKLLEYSIGGMREVTGVNVEFLGQTDKVQPGVVEAMRTKAGLVILAPWFDAMRLYMKRQGRLLAEYINKYLADGRWVRISGTYGPQQVQLAKQPDVAKYDIVVDEATQSRDSRERNFLALQQVLPGAIQAGIPIPPDVIDYFPLPEMLRMKWKQMIQQKMAQPPQPPLALQIEAMRGEHLKEVEQLRAASKQQQMQIESALKAHQIALQAEAERVTQAAQAESQRMVDASKLQLDSWTAAIDAKQEQQKMLLEARLNVFQSILDATVQLQLKHEETQAGAVNTGELLSQQAGALPSLFEQMVGMLGSHQQELADLKRVMSAPVVIERDPKTGVKRARRVMH